MSRLEIRFAKTPVEKELAQPTSTLKSWAMDKTEIIEAIEAEIQRLQEAKALLDGSPTTSKRAAKPSPKPGRRKMSAAGRARIAAAQKARWAKAKAGK